FSAHTIILMCSHTYDFKIAPTSKISKQKACTNERHPSWENKLATGVSELNEFCEKITITSEEENRLKIPESKQGWSTGIYTDVYDLHRLNHLPSIHDGQADSLQRPKQTSFVPSLEPLPLISLTILPRFNYTSGMQKMSAYSSTNVFS
ncbi:hypothetical protein L208DRAFT_1402820, partial [Tricholoma matsutake]